MLIQEYQELPAVIPFGNCSYINTSDKYVINPSTGAVSGPFGSNVKPMVRIGGKRFVQGEASKQNKLLQSVNLSHASWSKYVVGDSLTPTTDPLGGSTAYFYVPTTALDYHGIYQTKTHTTNSVFAKADGYNFVLFRVFIGGVAKSATLNLTTGTIVEVEGTGWITSSTTKSLAGGWWFFSVSHASASDVVFGISNSAMSVVFAGDGSSGVTIWQPQASTSVLYDTSLVSTTTAAVTRNKDQIYLPASLVPNELKDSVKFTLYPEWSSDQVTTGDIRNICEYADTTQNIQCYYDGNDKKVKVVGRANTIISGGGAGMAAFARNATTYFYTDTNAMVLKSQPIEGGPTSTLYTALTSIIQGLCVNSTHVYFFVYAGVDKGLYRCGLDGSDLTLLTGSVSNPHKCAINSTKVYWADQGSGKIKSYTLVGGAVTDERTGLGTPYGLAIDGTNIYWSNNTDKILYAPIAGGAEVELVSGLTDVRAIAVDDINIYWNNDAGGVYFAPLATGTPITTLTTGETASKGVFIYGSTLYNVAWTVSRVISIFKSPFSSGATTHSASQKLEVTLNRLAGTLKLGGFTTGDGTTVGISWNRTDSNLYIGMDATESKQWDGLIGEPEMLV